MRHFRQQFMSIHRVLLLIPTVVLILFLGAGTARAEQDIHGAVNASSLSSGETYRVDKDMVLTMDKNADIRKLIIAGCHVTVKGDGTLTIAEGIQAPGGTLVINSGHIKIDFTSSANSFSSAVDLVNGSLTLNGGSLDVSYNCTGVAVYTASAIEADLLTVNGGTLTAGCDSKSGHAVAINIYAGFTLTGGSVLCKAETHDEEKSAAPIRTPQTDNGANFLMTGGTLEAVSTSDIQSYGIDWIPGPAPCTAVIKGGTLKASASYAGFRTWAPLTISDGAHVELTATHQRGIALDADETTVTVKGKGTYIKAENTAENPRDAAVCAKDLTIDEKYQSIKVPQGGFFADKENLGTSYDYGWIVGPNRNRAMEVEIVPKELYSLAATVWNVKTGEAVTEASGFELVYNRESCGKPHYIWDVESNTRFVLDVKELPSGWTWKGWTIGAPDSYIRSGTETSTALQETMGPVNIHCYALVSGDEPVNSGNDETKPGNETRPGDEAQTPGSETQTPGGAVPQEPTKEEDLKPAADGTKVGKGASFKLADAAIRAARGEKDLPGSVFRLLKLTSTKQTKTSVTLAWEKVSGAKKYVIYGGLCGKKTKMVKIGEASASSKSKAIKKITSRLAKGTYYKFLVVAVDKKNKVLSTSKIVHVATSGGKAGNIKKVTIQAKLDKTGKPLKKYTALSSLVLKKGQSTKLKAVVTPVSLKLPVAVHRAVSYESSKASVAAVSSKGQVTAKKKGSCYIYAYAQNGVFARIKITVP